MKCIRAFVIVTLMALTACSAARMPVPLRHLAVMDAANSAFPSEITLALRDQQSWQNLWSHMHSNVSPLPPPPGVDFNQEIVLVAAAGTRPHGGFSIAITEVTEAGAELIVDVTITSPAPHCGATLLATSPVHIAAIPRSHKPVRFQVTQVIRNC